MKTHFALNSVIALNTFIASRHALNLFIAIISLFTTL